MRIKRSKGLVFFLVLLTLVSFVLTYLIIFRPVEVFSPNGGQQATNNQTQTTSSLRGNYSLEEVFSPKRFVYFNGEKLQMTSDAGILSSLNQLLNASMTDLQFEKNLSNEEYQSMVLQDVESQFLFDTPLPFGMVSRYFNNLPGEFENQLFSRILYRTGEDQTLYLLDDETKDLYKANLQFSIAKTLKTLFKEDTFVDVDSYTLKDKQVYIEVESQSLPQVNYLLEQVPMTFYINQLYANTTELRNRSDGSNLVYNDNVSQLKLDRTNRIVTYFRNRPDEEELTMTTTLQQALTQMKRLGSWGLGISYHNYDPVKDQVDFIRYIQDYPILSPANEGLARFVVSQGGIRQMKISTLILQTPIDSLNNKLTLPSGREVVDRLLVKGMDLSQIEDIRLGYLWTTSQESEQIISLSPAWFVKTNQTWKTLDQTLNPTSQEETSEEEDMSSLDPETSQASDQTQPTSTSQEEN